MKRFLPTIPAFLFCFIGGRLLVPASDDSSRSLAVLSLQTGGDDGGYEVWKKEVKEMNERSKSVVDAMKIADSRKEERAEMKRLAAILGELQKKFEESASTSDWREKVMGSPEFTALSSAKKELEEKKTALDVLSDDKSVDKENGFENRVKSYHAYKAALIEYDQALKENSPLLRKMADRARK